MTGSLASLAPTALRAGIIGAALFCSACAGIRSAPPSADAAAPDRAGTRAERVFLYQSRVADALLDRYPLPAYFDEADPALIAAEARMTETCSPLTRAVLANLEGERPSLRLRFQVFTTIDDCERAARAMDRLLHQPHPDAI